MIKVKRTKNPDILQKNQQKWTDELFQLITKYGSYSDIPESIKNKAVNKYRHSDIKKAVSDISKGKCVFCENKIKSVTFPQIEHFYPKSLYPKYTFKWSNLFLACPKCNIPKDNADTKKYPIVNPEKDNPEDYFTFENIRIETAEGSPNKIKSENTIKFCNLERVSLSSDYAEIQISLYDNENNLSEFIKKYNNLTQNAAQKKKAIKILEVLDNLKNAADYTKPHAGFLRYHIKNNQTIKDSIKILNKHKDEIGLTTDYQMNWN